jgi:RNA polymerase sigma-70 factor (ECF subfamily)
MELEWLTPEKQFFFRRFHLGNWILDQLAFESLIRRIRSGDEQAAAELVRQYEPLIRRAVRLHLEDERLRRAFDSTDVCQSVLASFFARTALGEYDLETPEHLIKLLVSMTRNKVATAAKRHYRKRRDYRRTSGAEELEKAIDPGPSPSELISGLELLERFRASFTDEERAIASLRKDGLSWAEITTQLGGAPQARRMQLARAIERISRQIGLDELQT